MSIQSIHHKMRRRLVHSTGAKGNYLHEDHSCLLAGTSWRQQQPAASGTQGLTLFGDFHTPQIGSYVQNVTRGFRAQIESTSGNELSLRYPLYTAETNWGVTDGEQSGKLIDSTASFTDDVQEGMIVALRNLSDHAVITAVDSDTQLSVSKNIFSSAAEYTIMEGFREGDIIRLGTAVLDGSAGQVMVEIPKFYFAHEFKNDKHTYNISEKNSLNLKPFYAFKRPDGTLRNNIYISAFEGSCGNRKFSAGKVLTDYDLAKAKLQSLPGLRPITNGQRSEFRQVARNAGPGCQIIDWYSNFAWQILFFAEYENVNSQSVLGNAMADWSDNNRDEWVSNTANRSVTQTGNSLSEGNKTGAKNGDRDVSGFLSYRGIENPWGHIWKWIDGINIYDRNVYLTNQAENYKDDIDNGPYAGIGVSMAEQNGYITEICNSDRGLFPYGISSGQNNFINDYYYQNAGWRVAHAGGYVANGAGAGFAALSTNRSSSDRNSAFGSRVCFRK